MLPADLHSSESVEGLIICLLIVALVALFAYTVCHLAGRPDWARLGAALIGLVGLVGALLCLLGAV